MADSVKLEIFDRWHCYRFTSFTRLELTFGILMAPTQMPLKNSALRELQMKYVTMSEPWASYIFSSLPHLTLLDMNGYLLCNEDGTQFQASCPPITTLR